MKPVVLILAVLAACTLGAGTVLLLWILPVGSTSSGPQPMRVAAPAGSSPTADPHGDRFVTLEAEVAMLGQQVVALQDELDRLRLEGTRRPVTAEQVAAAERSLGQAAGADASFTSAEREAVVEILAAVRAEEEEQRILERREREEERVNERAAEIAKELGLSLADQDTLGVHLLNAVEKRNEIMSQAREEGFDPRSMRESWEGLRDWNNEQLQTLFGPDLGDQIQRAERDLRGGFGRGGERGPDRGQGREGRGRTNEG